MVDAAMADLPVLYSFRRCPYAMRVRLALLVSGIICQIREVKLSAKPAEMIAISPKATVPVLLLSDGRVIDESLDIMRWVLGRADPDGWLDRADDALIARNDGPFKHHLDRYKYPDRHATDPAEHRAAGLDLLRPLEARLASAPFLGGDAMGLTDAAVIPFIRQFAETDRAWFDSLPLPQLQAWLARLLDGALFQAAMVRLVPWQSGDSPVLFQR
jgi:glutathione S-transferase